MSYENLKIITNNQPRLLLNWDELTAAQDHWTRARGGTPLGDETMAILAMFDAIAKIRGFV